MVTPGRTKAVIGRVRLAQSATKCLLQFGRNLINQVRSWGTGHDSDKLSAVQLDSGANEAHAALDDAGNSRWSARDLATWAFAVRDANARCAANEAARRVAPR